MLAVRLRTMSISSRRATTAIALSAAALLTGCGSAQHHASTVVIAAQPPSTATATTSSTSTSAGTSTSTSTGSTTTLPGAGKPPVTIGDKNFTEQFILGELYAEALKAQGFTVILNRNIGPTEVTIPALESGRLGMYPEYLGTWNQSIAGNTQTFQTRRSAFRAAQRYALAHGLILLKPTPFSNTDAIGVTSSYAAQNKLRSLEDLRKVATTLTVGAPPQFQQSPGGLTAIEQAYGFFPAGFKPLDVGGQYQALDQGTVQAADISTTDGELTTGKYKLLRDPMRVFGWGNVVPVISDKTLLAQGPEFITTINRVSRLLSTPVMRQLNAAVDIQQQDPMVVAKQFLLAHGIPAAT